MERVFNRKYKNVLVRPFVVSGRKGIAVTHDFFHAQDGLHMRVIDYMVFARPDRMLTVQCRVASSQQNSELVERAERLTPLFDRVAQSVAF